MSSHCLVALPAKMSAFNSYMRQNAYHLNFKCILEDLLPSYCYVTKANSKQFAHKFRNLPLHSAGKEEDSVNCKRIAACYQNSEPDTCAV